MALLDKLLGIERPGAKRDVTRSFSASEKKAVASSAQRMANSVNKSLKMARSSHTPKTISSQIQLAQQNILELKKMAVQYPFLNLFDLDKIEVELDQLQTKCLEQPFGQLIEERNGLTHISLDKSFGQVSGKHYTDQIDSFKDLKRNGNLDEARILLEKCVKAVERETAKFESKGWNWSLAPAYYRQLAIVYRKLKLYSLECSILERYINHPSAIKQSLLEFSTRLEKSRILEAKNR